MTKLSKEVPPLFGALSLLLIKEARRNEQGEEPPPYTVNELVVKLSYQAPNRIYTSPDGRTCRVFLFHEDAMPNQAYIEVAKPGERPGMWEKVKGEYMSFSTPDYLEKELALWRRRFGMTGDLLENPSSVFMRATGPTDPVEYIHVLEAQGEVFTCTYSLNEKLGPRMRDLRVGFEKRRPEETLILLQGPPIIVKAYAHPF